MISCKLLLIYFYSVYYVRALTSITTPNKIQTSKDTNLSKVQPTLSKRSTALDVIKELNNCNRLAKYVNKQKSVAVVTGGSSGIGLCTVEAISLTGMKVVLCARDVDSAQKAIEKFTQKNNIRIQKLDLTDLSNIETACKDIINIEGEIDVLINNAGVMAIPKREETKQGFEMQLGTNHIGHHMFTRLLLPIMNEDGGRVVTVASTAHQGGNIDKNDLNYNKGRMYTPWGAYSQSKLANILFAKGLQSRLKKSEKDILSISLHPGVINTPLWRNIPKPVQFVSSIIADKTIEQGAATNVFACLMESKDQFEGGEYLSDCSVVMPSKKAKDEDGKLSDWLWSETDRMIVDKGFVLPDF